MSSLTGNKKLLTTMFLVLGFAVASLVMIMPTTAFASSSYDNSEDDKNKCDDSSDDYKCVLRGSLITSNNQCKKEMNG
ncbi:hypothetical protein [Candidatus Nitrososphaera evergladensis]|nr:hypothetical protein [Candidatus Nitrososphaera evergladensis]